MGLYRKKPVMIEAVRFDGFRYVGDVAEPMFEGSFDVVPDWLSDGFARPEKETGAVFTTTDGDVSVLSILTLEGTVSASPGDFIIKGTAGELYPCKPKIFASIYEAVDEAARLALAALQPPADEEEAPGIGRVELTGGEEDRSAQGREQTA